MYDFLLRQKLIKLVKQQNMMGKFGEGRTTHYLYLINEAKDTTSLMGLEDKINSKIVENYDSALLQSV